MADSVRETQDKRQSETRFYITSLTAGAADISAYVRDHWAVETAFIGFST